MTVAELYFELSKYPLHYQVFIPGYDTKESTAYQPAKKVEEKTSFQLRTKDDYTEQQVVVIEP